MTLVPQQMATVDGVSVTLQDIRFSPTAVICNVQFAGLDAERAWAGTWSVAHEGEASIGEAAMSSAQFGEDPMQQTLIVHTGTDAPSGDWTFRIEELVGVDGDGEQIRLSGPWEFLIRVPEPTRGPGTASRLSGSEASTPRLEHADSNAARPVLRGRRG